MQRPWGRTGPDGLWAEEAGPAQGLPGTLWWRLRGGQTGTRMQGPALMGWTRETPTEGGRSDRILAVLESRGDRVC